MSRVIPVFDVTAYGAKGDSNGTTGNGTDNTTAVTAAKAAASVAGGILYFPAASGAYRMATTILSITAGSVHVRGDGMGASRLFFDTTDANAVGRLTFDGGASTITDVSVKNITVFNRSGQIANTAGIPGCCSPVHFRNCANVVCDSVEVHDSSSFSIAVSGCDDVSVTNCVCYTSRFDGIHVLGSTGTGARAANRVTVANNHCHDCNDDLIGIGYSGIVNDVTVAHNTVRNGGSRGIAILGEVHRVTVVGNIVSDTWLGGIVLDAIQGVCEQVTVAGNVIVNAGTYTGSPNAAGAGVACGVSLDGGSHGLDHVSITGNVMNNCQNGHIWAQGFGSGISTVGIYGLVVANNSCLNIAAVGGRGAASGTGGGNSQSPPTGHYPSIYLRNVQDPVVTGNFIYGAYQEAVLADAGNIGVVMLESNLATNCNSSATASLSCFTVSSGKGVAVGNIDRSATAFAGTVSLTTSIVNANNASTT